MRTLKQEGVGALWKGVIPTLVRDVPFSALYWELYEAGKRLTRRLGGGGGVKGKGRECDASFLKI